MSRTLFGKNVKHAKCLPRLVVLVIFAFAIAITIAMDDTATADEFPHVDSCA